jgi:hypothetical protein
MNVKRRIRLMIWSGRLKISQLPTARNGAPHTARFTFAASA